MLVGRPEARYEAYARAYAGCGDQTALWYRRSYARLYESVTCQSLSADDKFTALYRSRPNDIIGKYIRLEALDIQRHVQAFFAITNGDAIYLQPSYDPQLVWGFQQQGPFCNIKELQQSFVFQQQHQYDVDDNINNNHNNTASFAILQNWNDRMVGVIQVSKDQPQHLSIQLDPPIVGPSHYGSKEQLEACFLVMDRLFAYGYRRIQISIDSKDRQGAQLADRLGFTYEGCLLKHQIVKDANRDSNIYGILNSDWDHGARKGLYQKLYGPVMTNADVKYNKEEEVLEEQQRVLAKQREEEKQVAAAASTDNVNGDNTSKDKHA
jgi:RimJ/RimL family protein N-acetyltransferase